MAPIATLAGDLSQLCPTIAAGPIWCRDVLVTPPSHRTSRCDLQSLRFLIPGVADRPRQGAREGGLISAVVDIRRSATR
jgi:hypothetical protein